MFKTKFRSLKNLWRFLLGNTEVFSMEARIFHSVSVIAISALLLLTVYNLSTTLQVSAGVSAGIGVIQIFMYYLSRFKGKLTIATTITAAEVTFFIALTYFYNSGIVGSMLMLFVLTLFLIIVVIPSNQRFFWYLLNGSLMLLIVGLEYFNPEIIQQKYANRQEMFLDVVFTYGVVITLIYVCTVQLRRNYDQQKGLVEEKASKLEELNNQKDKLFSIISHDLNGPLASLKQYLGLLTEMELTPHERLVVETDLAKSLGDAQYLLENLLQWTKSQMENNHMVLEEMSLGQLLGPVLRMFEQSARSKNVDFRVNVDEQTVIFADKQMFQSVIRNLLNNAVKFTYSKGIVEINSIVRDGRCIITVRDNGTGIALEKQSKIFTLNIASSYGTELEKGTGLGLTLCKEFTERQGGAISFESTPEVGTTFYVAMNLVQK